jgi:hypothetical protein
MVVTVRVTLVRPLSVTVVVVVLAHFLPLRSRPRSNRGVVFPWLSVRPSFWLQCVDRRGATFLAGLRFETTVLGSGANTGLRVSLLPLPASRYLVGPTDFCAPSFVHLR